MRSPRVLIILLWLGASVWGARAEAKPLTDSVSTAVSMLSQPGLIEVAGQQNLYPSFGLMAAFEREVYDGSVYSGWRLGANVLLGRILASDWQANSILTAGLAGMKGPVHDHSALWARLDLDWESRQLLLAISGEAQRGNRMPAIDEGQLRLGYSPLLPEMGRIQPWAILSWLARSGTGEARLLGILRLMTGRWWLEVGSALTASDRFLNLAVAL